MSDIIWPNPPLLKATNRHAIGSHPYFDTIWHDHPDHYVFPFGPVGGSIKFDIKLVAAGKPDRASFRVTIEKLDTNNQTIQLVRHQEELVYRGDPETYTIEVPITSRWTRFRVTVSSLEATRGGTEDWYDERSRIFTAYTQYYGDFSLDYVPITILYCPPGQDMTNSLLQTLQYGTMATVGEDSTVGYSWGTTQEVRGGVEIGAKRGDAEAGTALEVAASEEYRASQQLDSSIQNVIAFSYQWGTRLVADNQRAIGRAYWGALGDLFVLLKNPWFEITGDEAGNVTIGISERTSTKTEILIVPAHRLLRPGDDPITGRIPEETRRRILELDPFITNLEQFFPDQGKDLSVAVDQTQNPSITTTGQNRAALIGRYSIDNGVVFDMSITLTMQVEDHRTNQTCYYAEVTDRQSIDTNTFASFLLNGMVKVGASLGFGGSSSNKHFTRIAYLQSYESFIQEVRNASCTLIRNQNAADLEDLEVWWDKAFSTFMFRKVTQSSGTVYGWIEGTTLGDRFFNQPVEIFFQSMPPEVWDTLYPNQPPPDPLPPLSLKTMTDHLGHFSFPNLRIYGEFELRAGNRKKRGKLTKKFISTGMSKEIILKGVKRSLNIKKCAPWELMAALNTDLKTARLIMSELPLDKIVTRRKFETVLKKRKISLREVSKRAIVEGLAR